MGKRDYAGTFRGYRGHVGRPCSICGGGNCCIMHTHGDKLHVDECHLLGSPAQHWSCKPACCQAMAAQRGALPRRQQAALKTKRCGGGLH
jgi:hypothetical protein